MPLFYQHNINETTRLGIWKIQEPESFFAQRVPLKKEVTHPHKRLQHLAARYLLPTLFSDFPIQDIRVADTRKPFLENERYHFSLSHTGDYAAALVSSTWRVGVDLEIIREKIRRLHPRFLHPAEVELGWTNHWPVVPPVAQDLILPTLIWCAKEALYKWDGAGTVDFLEEMRACGPMMPAAEGYVQQPFWISKYPGKTFQVCYHVLDGLALAWVLA